MTFSSFSLDARLLRAIQDLGFTEPTPIQRDAIPPAMQGRDVLACAMTGSGKTAAFVLPILQRLIAAPRGRTRALVITPTRELAVQINQHLIELARHAGVSSAAVYGGVGMEPQTRALRHGTSVIIATPGRLLDHIEHDNANFSGLEILVLDEADRMLDMGFLPDVRRILRHLPAKRQTLFFSATIPTEIQALSKSMLRTPVTINIERQAAPATGITHSVYTVRGELKNPLLVELLRSRDDMESVLVFTRTKHRANRVADYLTDHRINATRIHGNRSQAQRSQALDGFKARKYRVLVATDIAARGIDVTDLTHVVNLDVPHVSEDYIHRVGRTARAGAVGEALTFVSMEEESDLRQIERAIGQRLPRLIVDRFTHASMAVRPVGPPRSQLQAHRRPIPARRGRGRRCQDRQSRGYDGESHATGPGHRSRLLRRRGRGARGQAESRRVAPRPPPPGAAARALRPPPSDADLSVARRLSLPVDAVLELREKKGLTDDEILALPRERIDRTLKKLRNPHPDHPLEWMEWRLLAWRDENGLVPPNALMTAKAQIDALAGADATGGLSTASWTALGPGNIGGRVRAIAIHPTTTSTLFCGSVGGGIWKSTNGGANWSVVQDFMGSLSISSIVFQPGNPAIMYAGTGESFAGDGLQGAGIFKSVDGGTTWNQLASTNNSNFWYVNRLSISPDGATLLAGTGTGIWRTHERRIVVFERVSRHGQSRQQGRQVPPDERERRDRRTSPTTTSASRPGSTRSRSALNGGATFTESPGTRFNSSSARIEVAWHKGWTGAGNGCAYAMRNSANGELFRSIDGGATWALVLVDFDPQRNRLVLQRALGGSEQCRREHGERRRRRGRHGLLAQHERRDELHEDHAVVVLADEPARRPARHRRGSGLRRVDEPAGLPRERRRRLEDREHLHRGDARAAGPD